MVNWKVKALLLFEKLKRRDLKPPKKVMHENRDLRKQKIILIWNNGAMGTKLNQIGVDGPRKVFGEFKDHSIITYWETLA